MQGFRFTSVILVSWITTSIGMTAMNTLPYPYIRMKSSLVPEIVTFHQPLIMSEAIPQYNYRAILVPTLMSEAEVGSTMNIFPESARVTSSLPVKNDIARSSLVLVPKVKNTEPSRESPRCLLSWFMKKKVEQQMDKLTGGATGIISGLADPSKFPGGDVPGFPPLNSPELDQATQSFQNAQNMEQNLNKVNQNLNSFGNPGMGFPTQQFPFRGDLPIALVDDDQQQESVSSIVPINAPGSLTPSRESPRCLLSWFMRKKVEQQMDKLTGGATGIISGLADPSKFPGGDVPGFPPLNSPELDQATQSFQNAQNMEQNLNNFNQNLNSFGNPGMGFPTQKFPFRGDLPIALVDDDQQQESVSSIVPINTPGSLTPSRESPRCLLSWFVKKKVGQQIDKLSGKATGIITGLAKPAKSPAGDVHGTPSLNTPGLDQATQSFQNAQNMEQNLNNFNQDLNSFGNPGTGLPTQQFPSRHDMPIALVDDDNQQQESASTIVPISAPDLSIEHGDLNLDQQNKTQKP